MFEKLVESLSTTGKTIGEKTKQGSDIVKANISISSEEKALTELYVEIGKLYFENNQDSPCCDTMAELFSKVNEKKNSIEALKHQIRVIKGVIACDNCGAEVGLENDYCGKCGAKLVKPEPEEEKPCEEKSCDEKEPVEDLENIDHEETVDVEINIEVADDDSEAE